MSRQQIALKAEVASRVGATELLKEPGDAVLVVRGTPRWLLLRCTCGCGEEIPVNLDSRSGKVRRAAREPDCLSVSLAGLRARRNLYASFLSHQRQ